MKNHKTSLLLTLLCLACSSLNQKITQMHYGNWNTSMYTGDLLLDKKASCSGETNPDSLFYFEEVVPGVESQRRIGMSDCNLAYIDYSQTFTIYETDRSYQLSLRSGSYQIANFKLEFVPSDENEAEFEINTKFYSGLGLVNPEKPESDEFCKDELKISVSTEESSPVKFDCFKSKLWDISAKVTTELLHTNKCRMRSPFESKIYLKRTCSRRRKALRYKIKI